MRTPSFCTANGKHDEKGGFAVYLRTSENFKSLERERERVINTISVLVFDLHFNISSFTWQIKKRQDTETHTVKIDWLF